MRKGQPVPQGNTAEPPASQGVSEILPASIPSPDYLSLPQVALQLGLHRQTVVELILQGHLVASKLGPARKAHWRIAKRDLTAFLKAREAKTRRELNPVIQFRREAR